MLVLKLCGFSLLCVPEVPEVSLLASCYQLAIYFARRIKFAALNSRSICKKYFVLRSHCLTLCSLWLRLWVTRTRYLILYIEFHITQWALELWIRQCTHHSICIILTCEISLGCFGWSKVLTFILLSYLKLSLFQHSVTLVTLLEIRHCSCLSIIFLTNSHVYYLLNIWTGGFLVSFSLIFETHITLLI